MQLNHYRGGHGEPLVLIHGIGSRWQVWRPVLDRLRAEREVIAIDMPGFGDSAMPPPGTPPGAESLTRLISEWLEQQGLERPHVAGNSLGGRVSLELAKLGRVRSATAVSPSGFHNRPEGVFKLASLWLNVHGARLLAPQLERLLAAPAARRAAFGQMILHGDRVALPEAADTVRALAGAPWFDETARAISGLPGFTGGESIQVPVTIAWGDKDRLLLPRQAERARRAIPSARMITLTGCGHVAMYDDPVRVAEVLLEGSSG